MICIKLVKKFTSKASNIFNIVITTFPGWSIWQPKPYLGIPNARLSFFSFKSVSKLVCNFFKKLYFYHFMIMVFVFLKND